MGYEQRRGALARSAASPLTGMGGELLHPDLPATQRIPWRQRASRPRKIDRLRGRGKVSYVGRPGCSRASASGGMGQGCSGPPGGGRSASRLV